MKRIAISFVLVFALLLTGCSPKTIKDYEKKHSSFFLSDYDFTTEYELSTSTAEYEGISNSCSFLYRDICYNRDDVKSSSSYNFTAKAAACFNCNDAKVVYQKNVYDRIYPASITKLMTALIVVKNIPLDTIVTIPEDNYGITLNGASVCGLKKGDRITVSELLHCLLIMSGNDAALALAEAVSGSASAFCKLMNKTAKELGAYDTNFTNPHGLQDVNHYTTAYDIYLIFNECLKNKLLREIFSLNSYEVHLTDKNGEIKTITMEPTDQYKTNNVEAPLGITVVGGKTGSTIAAGCCLILYSENSEGKGYITEIFGAETYKQLYLEMNELLSLE